MYGWLYGCEDMHIYFILPIFRQAWKLDFFRELNKRWSMNFSPTNFASISPYLELISGSSQLIHRLSQFGFGETFRHWISLLYYDASLQGKVNSFLTESIPLLRGVRQGDPLSPLSYVLCMEVFTVNLHPDTHIEGLLVPGASSQRFQISQYADDCTCLVKTMFSLDRLFQLIQRYEIAAGAKLNQDGGYAVVGMEIVPSHPAWSLMGK